MSNQREPGVCIFCDKDHTDGHKLSGEHLWPQWIKKILPIGPENRHSSLPISYGRVGDAVFIEPDYIQRTGNAAGRKIKVPCTQCNNGWMSRIENEARPILTPLIVGDNATISTEDQKKIAAWAALRTIIIEFDDPSTIAVSPTMRKQIAKDGEPDSNWDVWIGTLRKAENRNFVHHGAAAAPPITLLFADPKTMAKNTQTTAIILGRLYLLTFSTFMPAVRDVLKIPAGSAAALRKVWPAQSEIQAPIEPQLTKNMANEASYAFIGNAAALPGL